MSSLTKKIQARTFLITAIALLLALFGTSVSFAALPEMVSITTDATKDHHTLTIELTQKAYFRVNKHGRGAEIIFRNVKSRLPHHVRPSTSLLRVQSVTTHTDKRGVLWIINVSVNSGYAIEHRTLDGPFRVVFEVFKDSEKPAAPMDKPAAAKEGKEVLAQEPSKKEPFVLNDSWQWLYRKKAVGLLRKSSDADRDALTVVFKKTLGIDAASMGEIIDGATETARDLSARNDTKNAELLYGVISFFVNMERAERLEELLRSRQGSRYAPLARFLLGRYNEKIGFYPEAAAYYSLVVKKGSPVPEMIADAMFRIGRIHFFNGRYDDARRWFKDAVEAGKADSALWLANTLYFKGENKGAWQIYSGVSPEDISDPVCLLTLADLQMLYGNPVTARAIYDELSRRYSDAPFLLTYFKLKSADTYFAQGNKDESVFNYTKIKTRLSGDEWAMASIALADAKATYDDPASLLEAEKIYMQIYEGRFMSSESAHLNLAVVRLKLGKFDEAIATVGAHHLKFPSGSLRSEAEGFKQNAVFAWLSKLSEERDHVALLAVYAKHGSASVPLGKKVQAHLMAGDAFYNSGLFPDAVTELNAAVRFNREPYNEEAMIKLARAYLAQKDGEATRRLSENFIARYPSSIYANEARDMLIKAAFLSGDYRAVADAKLTVEDSELLMLKAEALKRLKDGLGAIDAFSRALILYDAIGNIDRALKACVEIADMTYMQGRFDEAAASYKKALSYGPSGKERSWALYRLANAYSKLGMKAESEEALRELKTLGNDYSEWSEKLFNAAP